LQTCFYYKFEKIFQYVRINKMALSSLFFKRFIGSIVIIVFVCYFLYVPSAQATQNPLAVPNNKFGVHILFPDEISDAAKLIDSNGGDYGYVTIPIQSNDRDITKWQNFMDQAKKLHVIPL